MKKGSSHLAVLVTGASGMLGLKLCEILTKKGFDVFAGYYGEIGLLKDIRVKEAIHFDLTSRADITMLKHQLGHLDAIVHCAAMTEVNQCELNKKLCTTINVDGTRAMADLAQYFNAALIYISTPMIFSGEKGDYRETSRPNPINYYSRSKLAGERETRTYPKSLILRVNPIGVRPPGAHPSFVQWFVNMARENKSFPLFSDVLINPMSTTTLSECITSFIKNFKSGTLHLGSRDVVNKADIWRMIVKKFPNFSGTVVEKPANATDAGKIASRPTAMWLNVKKALIMGYPVPSWKKEVRIVLKELLGNTK